MRHRVETFGIFATEIDNPTIISAGIGSREFRVLHRAFPKDPQRGVQNGDIDLLIIHDREARFGIVAASRGPFGIGYLSTREQFFPVHPNSTNSTEITAHALALVWFVIDDEIFVASAVHLDANR